MSECFAFSLRKQRFVKTPSPIASGDYSASRLAADDRFQSATEFSESLTLAMNEVHSSSLNTAADDATVMMPSMLETVRIAPNDKVTVDKTINTKVTKKHELAKTNSKSPKNKWIGLIGIGLMAVIGAGLYIIHVRNKEKDLDNLLTKYRCAALV
jgi:hypothetical protein